MTIDPQREGESLEDRVEDSSLADDIIASLPAEEESDVEMGEDSSGLAAEPQSDTVDSEDVREGVVEEKKYLFDLEGTADPESAPVGPADYESPTHVSPQVLEEAHKFLNQYGIRTEHLTPKEVMEKIEKIHTAKEEASQVLSRGQALDGIERLMTFVPEGFVGGFYRENDMDVSRAESLGFIVFKSEEANLESSTGTPDGRVRLGDQILMIIPEEEYVANRLIKAERLAERRKGRDHKLGRVDQGSGGEGSHPLFPLIKL